MKTFQEMGLPEALNHTLEHLQFNKPTPIQQQAIPVALEGNDILGSAQTGTGKTAAFGVPLVAKLMTNPKSAALVMTPTRELATQVFTQIREMMGKNTKIKTAMLIGGDSIHKQLQQLRNRPRLIVGTPGRINDHLQRGSLMLNNVDYLVLDETDRMLDMGFSIQIDAIMKYMTGKRQTLLFSATLPNNITAIADKYLNDPVRISVSPTSSPAQNIKQDNIRLSEAEKYDTFVDEIENREGSIIVFIKTKFGTEKMAKRLSKHGHSADAIHGDLRQNRRDKVIESFRKKKFRILVATDVAARGLDIPHIDHVINYDLPQCAEDYIHRIGRTARAGAKGFALNLITSQDDSKWYAIERLLNPNSKKEKDNDRKSSNKNRKRKFGNKRKNDRAISEEFRSEKPRGEKPRSEKPRSEKPRSEKPRSEKPRSEKPRSEKPRSEKPRSEKPRSEKPRSNNKKVAGSKGKNAKNIRGKKPTGGNSYLKKKKSSNKPNKKLVA